MKVKLLQNIFEKDRFGNESLKVSVRKGRNMVNAFTAGNIIEMSETSAKKYIAKGLAVRYDESDQGEGSR